MKNRHVKCQVNKQCALSSIFGLNHHIIDASSSKSHILMDSSWPHLHQPLVRSSSLHSPPVLEIIKHFYIYMPYMRNQIHTGEKHIYIYSWIWILPNNLVNNLISTVQLSQSASICSQEMPPNYHILLKRALHLMQAKRDYQVRRGLVLICTRT